jgi:hypothetical protein
VKAEISMAVSVRAADLEDISMAVMLVYAALVAVGQVLAFYIAQAFDSFVPAAWSMIFYMSLFFGVIWAAWPIAVRITEKYLIKSQVPAGHAPRS